MNLSANAIPGSDAKVSDTPVLLLVGGLGTRLQSVLPSTPKPLAPIDGVSFLQLLMLQLRSQGFRRMVMCTGHLADQIEAEFGDGCKWGLTIEYSRESQPLGTAGAIKFAAARVSKPVDVLVANGDSFLELDFHKLIQFHRQHGGLATLALRCVPDAARYGTVRVDAVNRVVGFSEKTGAQAPGLINGGVYVFKHSIFEHIPEGPASLEKNIFPGILAHGVYGLEQHGIFIDIGTPEDYARAQALHRTLYEAAVSHDQLTDGYT
jgi:NDP-sugar pyrophosphorylase family protein